MWKKVIEGGACVCYRALMSMVRNKNCVNKSHLI